MAAGRSLVLWPDGQPLGHTRRRCPAGAASACRARCARMATGAPARRQAALGEGAVRSGDPAGARRPRRLAAARERARATMRRRADAERPRDLLPDADGKPLAAGARATNPASRRALLERVAKFGPDSFYVGPQAAKLVADDQRRGAQPVEDDRRRPLPAYDAKERPVLCSKYRAYKICSMGPPSSGGVTVMMILAQLERFDMAKLGKDNPRRLAPVRRKLAPRLCRSRPLCRRSRLCAGADRRPARPRPISPAARR